MKAIKCELPETIDVLKIEIFSDLHIGSKKCNYELIKERIEKVKDDSSRYCIILGDLLNNSTKTSVGDVYEEELTPMQQITQAISLFEPIKDKIILCTTGNHERRSYKTDGVDLMSMFARELGIHDKYDYCACLAFVRFGKEAHSHKRVYTIYATHGDGQGGRTIGGKANGLQRRGQIIPQCDVVVTGHTHQGIIFKDSFYELDYRNHCVHKKDQLFVNASATLNYEEYAELYGMRPSCTDSPVIYLYSSQRLATAIL